MPGLRLKDLWLSAALLALLAGAGARGDQALPSQSCKEAWARTPEVSRYDYARDARATANGNEGYAAYAARTARRNCYKDWTVLVYMAADNDLTPYAYWDLYEMEAGFTSGRNAAGSTLKSDLVVQLDTAGNHGVRRLHVFQTPTPYDDHLTMASFKSRTEKDIASPIVALLPENGGDEAANFERFLEWGMGEYPSRHYMVIVWGHGQGWAPGRATGPQAVSRFMDGAAASELGIPGASGPGGPAGSASGPASGPATPAAPASPFAQRHFGGLAFNDSQGTYLDIPALKGALKTASDRLLGGDPVDVYASDACLMQMVEVATEISEVARFVVGSSQVQNFLGLPYRRMMFELNTGRFGGEHASTQSDDEPYLVARMMPKLLRASLDPLHGLHGRLAPEGIKTITMSSLSASELTYQLLPALNDFGAAMQAYLDEDPLRAMDVQFVLQHAPSFEGGAQEVGAFLTLMKDLLRRESEKTGQTTDAAARLGSAVDGAKDALGRAVIAFALGTKYTGAEDQMYLMGFRAVSVWLPVSEQDYRNRIADFQGSAFYRGNPNWPKWLATVFAP